MPVYTTLPGQCFEQEIEVPSEGSKPVNKEIERPATRQMTRTPPLSLPSEERELEKIETVYAKPVTKKKKKKKKSAKSVAIVEVIETPVEEISIKPEALNDDMNIEDDSKVITETSIIQVPEINSLCGEKKLHTEITSEQEDKKLYLEPTRPRTRYGWPDKRSEKRRRLFLVGETKTTHIEVISEKKPEISRIKKIELEVKQFEESLKLSKDIESNTLRNSSEERKIDSGNHGEIILDMAEEDEKDAIARARISPELPTSEQISKGMRRVSPPPEIEITVPPCMLEPSHVKFIEDGKEVTLETVLEESKNKNTKKKFRIPKRLKGLLKK